MFKSTAIGSALITSFLKALILEIALNGSTLKNAAGWELSLLSFYCYFTGLTGDKDSTEKRRIAEKALIITFFVILLFSCCVKSSFIYLEYRFLH